MLPFTFQLADGVPVSDQLVQAVRKAMFTGQLAPGDLFPSVRTLSQELRISPTTAHKVVAQLRESGFLASRPGVGMVIIAPVQASREERLQQLEPLCRQLLDEAAELNLDLKDTLEAVRRAADHSQPPC